MIHVTHTAHQGQKKVFIRSVDTDLVSYLGSEQSRALPNDARLELAMIQPLVSMVKSRNQLGKFDKLFRM